MDQAEKKSKKSAKHLSKKPANQLPGPEFCKVPDHKKQITAPFRNVESAQSRMPDPKKQSAAPCPNDESPRNLAELGHPLREIWRARSRELYRW
ncbi:hypothetical protein MTO96_035240 [Rhipicephalus appendiculatus]